MDEESYIRQRYYYKNVKEKLYTKVYCLYGCIGYIILAPLHTISIQMQLSVSAHKDIYHDIIPKTDNLLENKGGVFSKLSEKYVPLINNAFNNIKKNEIEKIEKNLSIKLKKQDV